MKYGKEKQSSNHNNNTSNDIIIILSPFFFCLFQAQLSGPQHSEGRKDILQKTKSADQFIVPTHFVDVVLKGKIVKTSSNLLFGK